MGQWWIQWYATEGMLLGSYIQKPFASLHDADALTMADFTSSR